MAASLSWPGPGFVDFSNVSFTQAHPLFPVLDPLPSPHKNFTLPPDFDLFINKTSKIATHKTYTNYPSKSARKRKTTPHHTPKPTKAYKTTTHKPTPTTTKPCHCGAGTISAPWILKNLMLVFSLQIGNILRIFVQSTIF